MHPVPTIDIRLTHLIPIWPYKLTEALAVLLLALEDDRLIFGAP